MFEIIAAILGGILGGYLTWWFGRYRPNYIICDEDFRAELSIGGPPKNWQAWWNTTDYGARFSLLIGIPNTQILFQEKAVEELTLLTLTLRNTSDRPIDKPAIQVKLDEKAMVLGCDTSFDPERISEEIASQDNASDLKNQNATPCITSFDKNRINISLDSLFPHKLNKEILVLDVICSGKAGKPIVSGQGKFDDGTAWAAKYELWEDALRKTNKRLKSLYSYLILGFVLYSAYFLWFILSTFPYLRTNDKLGWLIQNPQFITFLAFLLGLFIFQYYLVVYRNIQLRFRIPFQKKRIVVKTEYDPPSHKDEKRSNQT